MVFSQAVRRTRTYMAGHCQWYHVRSPARQARQHPIRQAGETVAVLRGGFARCLPCTKPTRDADEAVSPMSESPKVCIPDGDPENLPYPRCFPRKTKCVGCRSKLARMLGRAAACTIALPVALPAWGSPVAPKSIHTSLATNARSAGPCKPKRRRARRRTLQRVLQKRTRPREEQPAFSGGLRSFVPFPGPSTTVRRRESSEKQI